MKYKSFYLSEKAKKLRLQDYTTELLAENDLLAEHNKRLEIKIARLEHDKNILKRQLKPWMVQP